jgi:hypothetical protein
MFNDVFYWALRGTNTHRQSAPYEFPTKLKIFLRTENGNLITFSNLVSQIDCG